MAKWFYYNENGDKIEVTGGQLKGLAKAGRITPDTIVETEEGKTAPARKVKGLTFVEAVPTETTPPAELVPPSVLPPPASVNSDVFNAAMNNIKPSVPPFTEPIAFSIAEQAEIDRFLAGCGCNMSTVDIKAVYVEGATLLHVAAQQGNLTAVKFLVSQGANVNAKTNQGFTPLFLAVSFNKNTEVAEFLISVGSDVKDGFTMHTLIAEGKVEAVRFLVSKGADVNAKIHEDATSLHMASLKGSTELAKVFVSAGADVNAKDNSGFTPLHVAAFSGHTELAKFLVFNGADIHAKATNGKTPSDLATQAGKADMFLYLTKAFLDKIDHDNTKHKLRKLGLSNPVFTAAEQAEINKFLVEFKCDVNTVDVGAAYDKGLTILHVAAHQENILVVKFLVSKGAHVNAKDSSGFPPLLYALVNNKITEVAEFLVSVGADVKDGVTMRALVAQGKNEAANFLVSKGAKAVHADSKAVATFRFFAIGTGIFGFFLTILGVGTGCLALFDPDFLQHGLGWHWIIAIGGVGILLLVVCRILGYRSSKLSSQCPSCKLYWAKDLTKTTEISSRVEQREENKVIGETRNSKGVVIAQQTQRVQYNVRVTTKENEYKCKHCGYEWKGTSYNEEARIS